MNDLAALLDEAASAAGVTRRVLVDRVEYLAGDTLVAVLDGSGASFRLRPDIVAAASRTPDASTSPRGPEWVAFRPRVLDRFARDRASAWLAFAVVSVEG